MLLNPDLKESLLKTQLCEYLKPAEFELLIAHSSLLLFKPKEIILKQGKISEGIYLILEGNVKIFAKILGEGTTNITRLGAGKFIGEISVIENSPCATSAIATEHVECLLIPKTYLDMLTLFFPETKYKILRAIATGVSDRLMDIHDKIINFISKHSMHTQSLFGEVIKSLSPPKIINFEHACVNKKYLQHSEIGKFLTQEELDDLLKHLVIIETAKHCTLISQGSKNAICYLILHGAVQSRIIYNNKVAKLSVLAPTTFFSSISTIEPGLSSIIDYTTCERAILLKIDEPDLHLIQKNNIHLWYKIFELICKSFVSLERAADKLDIRLNIELYNR